MCGIVGILARTDHGIKSMVFMNSAVKQLNRRGPDHQEFINIDHVSLGHARLSIIDTSSGAHQPFSDSSSRYTITFNGEIYNYLELKEDLLSKGYTFRTTSDTEVLLNCYIEYGKDALPKLNGFFAFSIYDKIKKSLFIARDRYGIKPLNIYQDENQIIWASELKAIFEFDIDKKINHTALRAYFKFNYIPKELSILKNVTKLKPGCFAEISEFGKLSIDSYYEINIDPNQYITDSYKDSQQKLKTLLSESIERRMVADVPLGSFLSGGIDSSIIAGVASEIKPGLKTFSIGYADEPLFDETHYAELVANKFKTNHHVFKLKNDDLFNSFESLIDYIDEPFADSSALAVNVLAKETKKHVTVSLSGDGADELFSGYNKHQAEYLIRNGGPLNSLKYLPNIWKNLPQSRNSKIGNIFRQLDKFSSGTKLSAKDRYWNWAGISSDEETENLLIEESDFSELKKDITKRIDSTNDFNEFLWSDLELVLTGDMLTKVDLMSMNNSLEVRVPFLDHELVNWANTLPQGYKIDKFSRKKILQDTYRDFLPEELYHRPKHGFEVPLLKWFKGPLQDKINNLLLKKDFIESQQIFNYDVIRGIVNKLNSSNPGDCAAKIWALIVFQMWWIKYIKEND